MSADILPVHAEETTSASFTVTIPKLIKFEDMSVGSVNETVSYDVTAAGTLPAGKTLYVTGETSGSLTGNNDSLSVSLTQDDAGWSYDEVKSGTASREDQAVLSGTASVDKYSGVISYTTRLENNKYTIKFDANGGSGTMDSLSCTCNTDVTLTANTFTRTGYTWEGWNTAQDGSGDSYADEASVENLTATDGETITLYAQWTPITYTITYDMNGHGTAKSSLPTTYTIEDTVTIGMPTDSGSVTDSGTTYYFTGWTGTDISSDSSPREITIPKGSTGNRTYTATWGVNCYQVTCEDWSIDYNGDPYAKLQTEEQVYYAEAGETFSGNMWNTSIPWYQYKSCTEGTVSEGPLTVYRYFWTRLPDIRSSNIDGTSSPVSGTIIFTYYDNQGNEIGSETNKVSNFVSERPYRPSGGKYTSADVTSDNGYELVDSQSYLGTNARLIWNHDSGSYRVDGYCRITKWDSSTETFVSSNYSLGNSALANVLKSKCE